MTKELFLSIIDKLIDLGYSEEINWQRNVKPCTNGHNFADEAIWVILNSGMKEQFPGITEHALNAISNEEERKIFNFDGYVKDAVITDEYAYYNGDTMHVMPTLPDKCADLVYYSPPFLGLFKYSSSPNDFSNCESREQALQQFELLVEQLARITKPGRVNAVHCSDLINKDGSQFDYPHEIEEIYKRHGFKRYNKITIWKEPLKVRMRTMVKSLMHKLIVEDATQCFTAMPDYVLIFKRDGENEVPVTHPFGLSEYMGETPLLPALEKTYGSFEGLKKKYQDWKDPKTNKLSHIIWQRYASSMWDDIRIDYVLPFRDGRDEDDEAHLHPLQLDVYGRLLELYTNPGELAVEPFAGVGSGLYQAARMGRKSLGIELKESYYRQGVENMKHINDGLVKPLELFEAEITEM